MSDDATGAFKETYADLYDRHLVPLLFAPYARFLAEQSRNLHPRNVLETAAGTGAVTQELAGLLPTETSIVATDLNQPMLDKAKGRPGTANVTWHQADAMKLPFSDDSFDLVVCQFGIMFFPDKRASFREASRVLRRGGVYLFAVWDDWAKMERAPLAIAAKVVGEILGCDPGSLVNPPYHDEDVITKDLSAANFQEIALQRVTRPAKAASARAAALATVHGSLIRTVIEATAPERLREAMDAVEREFRAQFGEGEILGSTTALVVTAEKFVSQF